ncbi:predicted protein [Sclerotinia sclerotiorum 1980 UF-70]|uniref:Uncharacterized protein n=1 Tax=Sclerotinia sclerotiorum (strain ATCC 18683 / 1980 / Ss-1) TaxID=665079 RepID=A7EH49_SCLS1|nr:predicted protein [Sclerotinia sclerotiorum 1980 UF-70]EDO02165.1 predicted protein [Sclerotinia sclerotiorum 1980 UF-70]
MTGKMLSGVPVLCSTPGDYSDHFFASPSLLNAQADVMMITTPHAKRGWGFGYLEARAISRKERKLQNALDARSGLQDLVDS